VSAYESIVSGRFTIEPPLTWSQIKNSRFNVEDGTGKSPDIRFEVFQEETETDEGLNIRIFCRSVAPYQPSRFGAYTLVEDAAELRDAFPGHEIRGEMILCGDDSGDIRRVVIDDTGVREEKARLLWPDGTEAILP
jgi:Family of unknown function (DUF6205)